MTFKKKTVQKYTQKRRRNRLKGGGDWYCRCDDTTKSKPSPSPAPAAASAPTTATTATAPAPAATATTAAAASDTAPAALKLCNTFKGRTCPKERCELETKKAAVQRTGKLQKKISVNDRLCLPTQKGGYKSKKRSKKTKGGYKSKRRSQIKKKKSKKPMLVIF